MPQYKAGYFSEAILKEFIKGKQSEQIKDLLNYLAHFELITQDDLSISNPDPIVSTYYNFISRGTPTLASTFVEDRIATTFIKTRKNLTENNFKYEFTNDELKDEIYRSLFIIDPRINKNNLKYESQNQLTKKLLDEFIPINIGEYFLQLLSHKRSIKSIFDNSTQNTELIDISNENFKQTNFDFTVELPYNINDNKGLTITVKSPKELLEEDFLAKEQLYEKLDKIKWKNNATISELNQNDQNEWQKIIDFTFDDFFDILRKNYTSPLYKNEFGLNAMQIALTPLAIARIQKTILNYILSGDLNLNSKTWKIAIIERDVPAAFLAIEDLEQTFNKLFELEGKNRKLPKIELAIFYTPEFEDAELNILYQGRILPLEKFDPTEKFDLLIDLSILLRTNSDFDNIKTNASHFAKIRSANFVKLNSKFITTEKINYKLNFFDKTNKSDNEKQLENKTLENLNFFVKYFFRKNKLSYLQFKFLVKILNNKNSLCVVPPKEKKDFLYKIAVLLQPGISLIITPLMSALKFQFDNLGEHYIDAASYFSPYTEKIFDKNLALEKISTAKSLFNYITPDRLHLTEYRKILKQTIDKNIHFSYIVIDEVHCASEWSHDFRALYGTIPSSLNKIFGQDNIPALCCLTEIASYDTAEDLKHLFNIDNNAYAKAEINFRNLNLNIHKVDYNHEEDTEKEYIQHYLLSKFEKTKEIIQDRTVVISSQPNTLANHLGTDKTAVFEGTIGDRLKTISTLKSRKSYKQMLDFNNEKYNYLSGTFSLGIGTYFNSNNLIFCDIPTSVEMFIQTISKLNDKEKLQINLVFSDQKFFRTKYEIDFDEHGKLIEKQFSEEIFIENYTRQKNFDKLYSNAKKKLLIINELMNNVTYPSESVSQMLIRRVRYSFDLWIKLESQPIENPTKLYVYDSFDDNLGYIDLEKNSIVNLASASKAQLSQKILSFIKYDIDHIVANGLEIFDILNDEIKQDANPGINNIWANLKKNEQTSLTVEFYNDSFSQIKNILIQEFNIKANLNQIIEIYETSSDIDEFKENFKKIFSLDKIQYKKINLQIQNLFWNFRNFFDTADAIYRLFSVGIVEDFYIDYQNQLFTLLIKKKDDSELLNKIYKRISDFVSKNQAIKVFEEIPKSFGKTMLEKSVNFFEKFINKNAYKKREQSFDEIIELIYKFQQEPDKIKNNLSNYFSARYIGKIEKINIDKNLNFIDKYFDTKTLLKDKLQHLYKSAEIISNSSKSNCTSDIIYGLSGIMLKHDEDKILLKSVETLAKGLNTARFKFKITQTDQIIDKIFNIISAYNIEIISKIETYFTLKLHTLWLQSFNTNLKNKLSEI
jgi:superfamily II DNA helicase RecQ